MYLHVSTENEVGKESDFSSGRFNVLRLLDQAGERGLLMTEVASGLNMSITNLPKLMDDLADRKLITRVRDKDDGRRRWARLTPDGKKLLGELVPRASRSIRKAWSPLGKREIKQLIDLLARVDAKLDARMPKSD
jgi:DNA-binding MarR family transcriptional regulator